MQEDETGLRHLFGVAVAGCPAMSPRRTGARMRPVQGRTGWREQTAEGGGGHEVWRPRGSGGGGGRRPRWAFGGPSLESAMVSGSRTLAGAAFETKNTPCQQERRDTQELQNRWWPLAPSWSVDSAPLTVVCFEIPKKQTKGALQAGRLDLVDCCACATLARRHRCARCRRMIGVAAGAGTLAAGQHASVQVGVIVRDVRLGHLHECRRRLNFVLNTPSGSTTCFKPAQTGRSLDRTNNRRRHRIGSGHRQRTGLQPRCPAALSVRTVAQSVLECARKSCTSDGPPDGPNRGRSQSAMQRGRNLLKPSPLPPPAL